MRRKLPTSPQPNSELVALILDLSKSDDNKNSLNILQPMTSCMRMSDANGCSQRQQSSLSAHEDSNDDSNDDDNSYCVMINQQQFLQSSEKSNTKTNRSQTEIPHWAQLNKSVQKQRPISRIHGQVSFQNESDDIPIASPPKTKRRLNKMRVHSKKHSKITKKKPSLGEDKNICVESFKQRSTLTIQNAVDKFNNHQDNKQNQDKTDVQRNAKTMKNIKIKRNCKQKAKPKSKNIGKKKDDMSNRIYNAIIDHFM